jgi:hypothetical protein
MKSKIKKQLEVVIKKKINSNKKIMDNLLSNDQL